MSDVSDFWAFAQERADFAMLGARVFLCDGLHANLVLGQDGSLRVKGVAAQRTALGLEQSQDTGAGEHLALLGTYVWGVQRVLTDGSMEVLSTITIGSTTMTGTNNQAAIVLEQYPDVLPTGWKMIYRIWRSEINVSGTLYLLKELDAYQAQYVDNSPDSALDLRNNYVVATKDDVDTADPNCQFPPCRFIRAWKGRMVGGGSLPYAEGTIATDKDSLTVAMTGGTVRPSDVDGMVRISGEPGYFLVTAVDIQAGEWTLNRKPTTDNAAIGYVFQHQDDVIYVSNPLPGNIEGYTLGEEVYSNAGSGNRLTGIAEQGGMLYVLREHRVETLESGSDGWTLEPLPDSPPGCVSHATISDRFSPRVYYYAGKSGIWEISGAKARRISMPVQKILDDEVFHAMDRWTHGVFDPRTGLYHLWLYQEADVEAMPETPVPSLLLTYDTQRDLWYKCELSATASGIWKDSAGAPYPVIGIPGGVARLDALSACDGERVTGKVSAADSATLTAVGTPFAGKDLRGFPVVVGAQRLLIESHTDNVLTMIGEFLPVPAAGTTFTVGAMRWGFTTGELVFASAQDLEKKFSKCVLTHDPTAAACPLTITLRGVRAESAKSMTHAGDMRGQGEQLANGSQLGLRGKSCRVSVAGEVSGERLKVIGLVLEASGVKK